MQSINDILLFLSVRTLTQNMAMCLQFYSKFPTLQIRLGSSSVYRFFIFFFEFWKIYSAVPLTAERQATGHTLRYVKNALDHFL
jgi:hypothetical protein